jgi:hypothetical protein
MAESGDSYPHWLGLLKWSLAQTDPNGNSDFTEMSKENREFLDAVMKDMVKDEPGDLQKILEIFREMFDRGVEGNDNSRILDLLEDAQMIVDHIDMANVFLKFGGAPILLNILKSDQLQDDCKCAASVICGEIGQNNPEAQRTLITSGLLDQLAVTAASPHSSPKLCNKSMYGISCIIRGSSDGEERFCNVLSGPELLKRVMERQDTQCSKRVMFLANALIMSEFSTPHRVSSILSTICPHFIAFQNDQDADVRETCLRLLETSVTSSIGKQCLRSVLASVQEACMSRLNALMDNEQDEYEKQLIDSILSKLSKSEEIEVPPSSPMYNAASNGIFKLPSPESSSTPSSQAANNCNS